MHSAGVLADALLVNQTQAGLHKVWGPKASAAWNFHTADFEITSEWVVFAQFSSVAALLGGAGQANYSAANVCLDVIASYRSTHGAAATSVQWGAWAEVGMGARGAANERAVSGRVRVTI
mgnify:CR=1 FL=1